ncbi:MAG: hypothetical protein VB031_05195 [Eubacteriaceae bacterium]|nr:hypothetical protein [Eubacteriaceae bacterium]
MKRKFEREFRENEALEIIEKIKIGVVGAGRGSGTSFIASGIALAAAEHYKKAVAFAELPDGTSGRTWLYDIAGMDKRFGGRNYESLHKKVRHGRYIRGIRNMDSGVNWAACTAEDRNSGLTDVQKARLINNISGDIVICDMGINADEEIMADMDAIICVVDPKPSRLIDTRELYQTIKQEQLKGRDVIWVLNKMNGGVNRRCFREYVKIKGAFEIPLIKDIHFYAAEYNCRFPAEQREIKKVSNDILQDIVKKIIV